MVLTTQGNIAMAPRNVPAYRAAAVDAAMSMEKPVIPINAEIILRMPRDRVASPM
jgi:hypothetical protein